MKRKKERKAATDKNNSKKKNKTEEYILSSNHTHHTRYMDRCINRSKPVLGGRIVAEYDHLTEKVTHLYTLRKMVLPEDELEIFNEDLKVKLEDTNQQLNKWVLLRWKAVVDHSMKRVQELAKANNKPI